MFCINLGESYETEKTLAGAAVGVSFTLAASQAFADATLDRIKERGALTVGVILSGAPFGFIDPATQSHGVDHDRPSACPSRPRP
jgi:ABC-type amino acid transport substrate-binding protein